MVHAEIADPEPDDLGDSHTGQVEAQDQLVPPTDIARITDSEQDAVRLLMGQPPGRVLTLQLPVERRRVPERVLPALQLLDQASIGQFVPHAPAQEDADPREPVAAGVVGSRQSDPLVHRCVGERPRMRHTDVPE